VYATVACPPAESRVVGGGSGEEEGAASRRPSVYTGSNSAVRSVGGNVDVPPVLLVLERRCARCRSDCRCETAWKGARPSGMWWSGGGGIVAVASTDASESCWRALVKRGEWFGNPNHVG
jgi:hypothetical protein